MDADGLNAHAGRLELFARARRRPPCSRRTRASSAGCSERDSDEVARHRLACAREAAERSGAVVLLKGDDTIVALPGGEVAVSPGGTPALATAGTGDVLSGLIGALLAKGLDAVRGRLPRRDWPTCWPRRAAAERRGADHVMAGDVIDALPHGLTLR